jgi:hypothetical protein
MLRWIAFVVLFSLAACQSGAITVTPTLEPTAQPTPDEVAEVHADGITLALDTPRGWQSIPNERGILLAEHAELSGSDTTNGILVYVFVQPTRELELETFDETNLALRLLNHVTKRPDSSLDDATLTQTEPLRVGLHDAAYYLLSDEQGNRTLVLALSSGATDKVIVCNVSASYHDSNRIREVLPMMLSRLTIDGETIDLSGLDILPDPLIFPIHHHREADAEATPDSTPDL